MSRAAAPAISVVMGVHNGAEFLHETLASISRQTFEDFEFLIVDDASSDSSPDLLAHAADRDARLRVIRLDENQGLTNALNVGLSESRGRYIARIDADDRSLPTRLQVQHDFLEANGDHIAVGCGHRVINASGHTMRTNRIPLDDWQIRWLSGFNPPAPHPTYFFRRLGLNGRPLFYDPSFRTAQDFDLWSRMIDQGRTAVVADVLLEYRRHDSAITVQRRKEQAACCRKIGTANLRKRLPSEVADGLGVLHEVFAYNRIADRWTIRLAVKGLDEMLAYDLPLAPSGMHRRWLRRTAAGLLADCVLSRGAALHSPKSVLAFVGCAYHHFPALASAVFRSPGIAAKSLAAVNRVRPGILGQILR